MSFTCRAYGLTIRSDIALRGPLAAAGGAADVTMAEGRVPDRLDKIEAEKRHWSANRNEVLLRVPGVGRFHVCDGTQVRYQRVPGACDDSVGGFLLGSCVGAILHQRGIPVLHGACVAFNEQAVAICGKSGRGKSTTSAWLVERGARMLSDDLTVFGALDPPCVMPGYPQSKLTGAALEGLGLDAAGLRAVDEERGKFALPRDASFVDRPLPLTALFVIETGSREDLSCQRLGGLEAVRQLVKHTYRRGYVVEALAAKNFSALGHIASHVPVWLLIRPRSAESTGAVVSAVSRALEYERKVR